MPGLLFPFPTASDPSPLDMFFDGSILLDALRAQVCLTVRQTAPADLDAAMRAAVVGLGGCLTEPQPDWGPVEVELTLLGLFATGETLSAAAHNWAKVVNRTFDRSGTQARGVTA